jgi:hypothetical protein
MKIFKKNLFIMMICSCGLLALKNKNQADAWETAAEISKMTDQKPSYADGVYMKATIDGKKWVAANTNYMYWPGTDYELISGDTDDISIDFQLRMPRSGMKRELGKINTAIITRGDDVFGIKKGEITFTKADESSIEGTFYFTAISTSSAKTIEVKDGSFRVAVK